LLYKNLSTMIEYACFNFGEIRNFAESEKNGDILENS